MAADQHRPQPNQILAQPATVAACDRDRAQAQGPAAARTQLGEARSHGNGGR